ncbi:hypothetical protein HN681_04745 [archaeon]|jgi:hypothetical protein|nr:hypothetical protein [archaeon]MBT3731016.1 hypothetical protein [archaeon]MBT4669746.1 hypothetical protein [archaeon]MBT5029896.1 hypothetical protein [archaeon]MBT5288468.1 hypothetical protein [archaeon]
MPVISFSFDKINIEKKKTLEAPIKVDNGMTIVDLKLEDVPITGGKKEKVLRFFYEYKVDYQPDQAIIEIAGNLVYHDPDGKTDELMKGWKDSKQLPPEMMQQVMNNVLIRCQIKALSLAQDLGLPPHIRIPTISPKTPITKDKKAEEYIG